MAEASQYTIEDHSSKTPDGKEKTLFILKWGNNRQSFKTRELAEKFIKQQKLNQDKHNIDKS